MKKILTLGMMLACLQIVAQPNNPMQRTGIDLLRSVDVVMAEVKSGAVKTVDEPTIRELQKKLPVKTEMDVAIAAQVFEYVKSNPVPLFRLVQQSRLKPEVQREVLSIVENSFQMSGTELRKWLEEKTGEWVKAPFTQPDKDVLLTVAAMQYETAARGDGRGIRCSTRVNDELVHEGAGMDCAAVAALAGFVIGNSFCGFLCGLGGAVVGFVAVALGSGS